MPQGGSLYDLGFFVKPSSQTAFASQWCRRANSCRRRAEVSLRKLYSSVTSCAVSASDNADEVSVQLRVGSQSEVDSGRTAAQEILKKFFDFDAFLEGQWNVINSIINRQYTVAVMATNSGKSLCYQIIPLLEEEGLTVVVEPLVALMKDQVDQFNRLAQKAGLNWKAAHVCSYNSSSANALALQQARQGQVRLLYMSPESLHKLYQDAIPVRLLVVDEAHCVAQWGSGFRPGYGPNNLRQQIDYLKPRAVLAMTGSATKDDMTDLRGIFPAEPVQMRFGSQKRNMNLHVSLDANCWQVWRFKYRMMEFQREGTGACIVYVSTVADVDRTIETIRNLKFTEVKGYHGGMTPEVKCANQAWFMNHKESPVIVATSAFGMGVNCPKVRLLFVLGTPLNLTMALQQIGRAGRDGNLARCYVLASYHDSLKLSPLLRVNLEEITIRQCIERIFSSERDVAGEIDANAKLIGEELSIDGREIDQVLNALVKDEVLKPLPVPSLLANAIRRFSVVKDVHSDGELEKFAENVGETLRHQADRKMKDFSDVQEWIRQKMCYWATLLAHHGELETEPCGRCTNCSSRLRREDMKYKRRKETTTLRDRGGSWSPRREMWSRPAKKTKQTKTERQAFLSSSSQAQQVNHVASQRRKFHSWILPSASPGAPSRSLVDRLSTPVPFRPAPSLVPRAMRSALTVIMRTPYLH